MSLLIRLLQVGGVLLGSIPVVISFAIADGRPGPTVAGLLAAGIFVFAITRGRRESGAAGWSFRVAAVWCYAFFLAASLSFIGTFAAVVVGTAVAP